MLVRPSCNILKLSFSRLLSHYHFSLIILTNEELFGPFGKVKQYIELLQFLLLYLLYMVVDLPVMF